MTNHEQELIKSTIIHINNKNIPLFFVYRVMENLDSHDFLLGAWGDTEDEEIKERLLTVICHSKACIRSPEMLENIVSFIKDNRLSMKDAFVPVYLPAEQSAINNYLKDHIDDAWVFNPIKLALMPTRQAIGLFSTTSRLTDRQAEVVVKMHELPEDEALSTEFLLKGFVYLCQQGAPLFSTVPIFGQIKNSIPVGKQDYGFIETFLSKLNKDFTSNERAQDTMSSWAKSILYSMLNYFDIQDEGHAHAIMNDPKASEYLKLVEVSDFQKERGMRELLYRFAKFEEQDLAARLEEDAINVIPDRDNDMRPQKFIANMHASLDLLNKYGARIPLEKVKAFENVHLNTNAERSTYRMLTEAVEAFPEMFYLKDTNAEWMNSLNARQLAVIGRMDKLDGQNTDWFAYAVLQKNPRNNRQSVSAISETEQQLFDELQSAAERFTLIQRTHEAQEIKQSDGKTGKSRKKLIV